MEIELQLVVEHADNDLLHELNFCWASDLLHTGCWLAGTLANQLRRLKLFILHCDHKQVVELELGHLGLRVLNRVAHELVFCELAQRKVLAESHELAEALSVLRYLGLYLRYAALGVGQRLLERVDMRCEIVSLL